MPSRTLGGGQHRASPAKKPACAHGTAARQEENKRLRKLVVELSKIVLKNVLDAG
jgi:hypothetical protein